MNFAPMQLVRLWIDRVSIEPNSEWAPTAGQISLPFVGFPVVTLQRSAESPTFRLLLTVQVPAAAAEPGLSTIEVPYSVDARFAATFAFFPDTRLDEGAMRRMVAYNGLSVLYGFARDAVQQITAQCEHGPFVLPIFNISDVSRRLTEQQALAQSQDSGTADV